MRTALFAVGVALAGTSLMASDPIPCQFSATGVHDPFKRFFSQAKVECGKKTGSRADTATNLFWKRGSGLTADVKLVPPGSAFPTPSPGDFVPFAKVKISTKLGDDERLFVYVPRFASVIPLTLEAGRAAVPAELEIVPILIKGDLPVSVAEKLILKRAEERAVSFDRSATPLMAWVSFRNVPAKFTPPQVTLSMNGGSIQPIARVDAHREGDMPLVIFSNVKNGTYELRLTGESWYEQRRTVTKSDELRVVTNPLIATSVQKLTINWSVINDPRPWASRDAAACELPPSFFSPSYRGQQSEEQKVVSPTFIVMGCSSVHLGNALVKKERPRCVEVSRTTVDLEPRFGRVELPRLAAGDYRVRFLAPAVPELMQRVNVPESGDAVSTFDIKYERVFGRITRDGKPVRALVDMPTAAVVSDEATGDYDILLAELLTNEKRLRIEVTVCGENEAFHFFPERKVESNSALDIEIPGNSIEVILTDAEKGTPIKGGNVSFAVLIKKGERAAHFAGSKGKTDDKGTLTIRQIDSKKHVLVCGAREDYELACAESFAVASDEKRKVVIPLKGVSLRFGRLLAPTQIVRTVIIWSSSTGNVTEQSNVKEDGAFSFKKDHTGELMTLMSESLPLFTQITPPLQRGQSLDVSIPNAPIRSFTVSSSAAKQAHVTLAIGKAVIPGNVFMHRGGQIIGGQEIVIANIVESEPITVLLLPFDGPPPFDHQKFDLFYAPETQPHIQRRLVSESFVRFNRENVESR